MPNFAAMRFKKHISILLTFLLLASNMGMAINVHYCGGEVSSVSLDYKQAEACGSQKKEMKSCCAAMAKKHKSCCDNDVVKLQDKKSDNIIVKSLQLDLGAFYMEGQWQPVQFYAQAPLVAKQTPSFYCDSHAPPLFKLYCQYVFYA
jgi:hypothetical protein